MYIFYHNQIPLYVGKASNLKNRLQSYLKITDFKTEALHREANKLKLIKSYQEKGMSLSAIIGYLKGGEVKEAKYLRDVWVKYEIIPGLEITVRRDIEEKEGKRIFELVRIARSIIKEE